MRVKKKTCKSCLRELVINVFPRMGKADTCKECKFRLFNKDIKVSAQRREMGNSILGNG